MRLTKKFKEQILRWYRGELSDDPLIFVFKPHWTAQLTQKIIKFLKMYWQWLIPQIIGLLALAIAYFK